MRVHPSDQLHIFADGVCPVSADGQDDVLTKDTERAGDDEDGVEGGPADPTVEERPEILDHLIARKPLPGKADRRQTPVFDPASVGYPNRATDRDRTVVGERLRRDPERVGVQYRVSVQAADEGVPC